ncbi:Ig-like domain-containing protein [Levilactobacillus lanxiensis]|uniref:Ig-like domain-containing protein n=1 Tax=Levilactobacillus lanxiensis TaxID=2799568 RepID=A0ABW4D5T9_9LACO|nr:Ig-like domain-containing protein [Levilactobacillus lanxiensis]
MRRRTKLALLVTSSLALIFLFGSPTQAYARVIPAKGTSEPDAKIVSVPGGKVMSHTEVLPVDNVYNVKYSWSISQAEKVNAGDTMYFYIPKNVNITRTRSFDMSSYDGKAIIGKWDVTIGSHVGVCTFTNFFAMHDYLKSGYISVEVYGAGQPEEVVPPTNPEEPGTGEPGPEEPGPEVPGVEEPGGPEAPGVEGPGTEKPGGEIPGTSTPGVTYPPVKPEPIVPEPETPVITPNDPGYPGVTVPGKPTKPTFNKPGKPIFKPTGGTQTVAITPGHGSPSSDHSAAIDHHATGQSPTTPPTTGHVAATYPSTTLPQTSDRKSTGILVAGLTLLLASLTGGALSLRNCKRR